MSAETMFHPAVEDVLSAYMEGEFSCSVVDAMRGLPKALQAFVLPCRALNANHSRCVNRAEFLLWGKLFSEQGPMCYDHAAEVAGHRALTPGCEGYAILDLRPAWRALEALS